MAIRDKLRRHRKDNRWIVGILASVLAVLTLIYYFVQKSRDLPSEIVTDSVLLFFLRNINAVLILCILFVLVRNLVKLMVERRRRILGSKFKTKLVATYVGLSLIPVLLLFVYGSGLLQGWIEGWFDEPAIKRVTEQGYAVAQALNRQIEDTRLRDARRVMREVRALDFDKPTRRPQLTRRLQHLLRESELDYLAVYSETEFVHAVINPQSGLDDLPEPEKRLLVEALRYGQAVKIDRSSPDRGRLILTFVSAPPGGEGPRPVVVAGVLLDPTLASQSEQVIQAYQSYRQLAVRKGDIKAIYILNFLMVTLLILLTTSWVGLYLARRITIPIQALAEATERISRGDLDYRVEVTADDELNVLVQSFNSMTAELKSNKELLEQGNRELVEANQRLAEERAVIGAVLQNVAAGVISVDQDGQILTCNGAACRMLDLKNRELVGRPLEGVLQDSERRKLIALFAQEPNLGSRMTQVIELILGGEWRTFEAKVTTMKDREGEITGKVMVLEDLTKLIQAQQTAAWNDAARRIAHEIKNPLTPIKLAAERLLHKHRQADPNLGRMIEEAVETISREVQAMKGMVDEFSRFARMPRPQPTEANFGKLIDETISLYCGLKAGIEVKSAVDPDAEVAWIDQEQIKRVLINLIDNAVEAIESPGLITVTAQKINGALRFEVADDGPGIPADAKDKLFLPYFSTKGRGTGLGLSIVHRIVSDHHGTIRVRDNQPRGAVFSIELPQI